METLELNYRGLIVPFSKGERVFQKITPILHSFGEKANNYFRGQERAKRYAAIAKRNGLKCIINADTTLYSASDFAKAFPDMVKSYRGHYGGTWISQEVVIDFAQFLSPDFAAWCDEQMKMLLDKGEVKIDGSMSQLKVMRQMIDKMIEQEDNIVKQDKKIHMLEEHLSKKRSEEQVKKNYHSVSSFAYLKNIHVNHDKAREIAKEATKKCRERDVAIDNYIHTEFGTVYVYPDKILAEVFKEMF